MRRSILFFAAAAIGTVGGGVLWGRIGHTQEPFTPPHKKTPRIALFYPAPVTGETERQKADRLSDANEKMYGFNGAISGTVRFADGKPASDYRVEAHFVQFATGSVREGYAITDGQGHYKIHGLAPSAFRVVVNNQQKPFVPRTESEKVALGTSKINADNVDFVLEPGPEVTVRVRDAETGSPVSGLQIEASPFEESKERQGETNEHGEFVYRSPSKNINMAVQLDAAQRSALREAPGYGLNYHKHLEPGQKVIWDIKTYSQPDTPKVVPFRVVISDEFGKPMTGVHVRLLGQEHGVQHPITGDEGRFETQIDRVNSGTDQSGTILLMEKDERTMVRFVKAEETWDTLHITWQPTAVAMVTGLVKDPTGKPLANVPIRYYETFRNPEYRSNPSGSYRYNEALRCTDANGRFSLQLHPEAVYSFQFGDIYQQGGRFNCVNFPAVAGTFVEPKPNEVKDLGVITVKELMTIGNIAGKVIGSDGKPLTSEYGRVLIEGKHTSRFVNIDYDGSFQAEKVMDEPLKLMVVRYDGMGGKPYVPGKRDVTAEYAVKVGATNLRIVAPSVEK